MSKNLVQGASFIVFVAVAFYFGGLFTDAPNTEEFAREASSTIPDKLQDTSPAKSEALSQIQENNASSSAPHSHSGKRDDSSSQPTVISSSPTKGSQGANPANPYASNTYFKTKTGNTATAKSQSQSGSSSGFFPNASAKSAPTNNSKAQGGHAGHSAHMDHSMHAQSPKPLIENDPNDKRFGTLVNPSHTFDPMGSTKPNPDVDTSFQAYVDFIKSQESQYEVEPAAPEEE